MSDKGKRKNPPDEDDIGTVLLSKLRKIEDEIRHMRKERKAEKKKRETEKKERKAEKKERERTIAQISSQFSKNAAGDTTQGGSASDTSDKENRQSMANGPITKDPPPTTVGDTPNPDGKSDVETSNPETSKSKRDEEVLLKLGADPTADDSIPTKLHPDLLLRWKHWLIKGLPKEQKDELMGKYSRKGECPLEAPKVNPEVEATMADITKKRDRHFRETQNSLGSAMAGLGTAISMILNEEEEGIDKATLLENLCDAGRLMADIHHSQSVARRAFISPTLDKQLRPFLDSVDTDEWLYGTQLSEKVKNAKTIKKTGKTLKTPAAKRPPQKPNSLNWRGLPVKPRQAGENSRYNAKTSAETRPSSYHRQHHQRSSQGKDQVKWRSRGRQRNR